MLRKLRQLFNKKEDLTNQETKNSVESRERESIELLDMIQTHFNNDFSEFSIDRTSVKSGVSSLRPSNLSNRAIYSSSFKNVPLSFSIKRGRIEDEKKVLANDQQSVKTAMSFGDKSFETFSIRSSKHPIDLETISI